MDYERLRLITLYSTGILLTVGCLLLLRPFIGVFAWATALAVILEPLYRRLHRRIPSATLAALAACLVFAVLILLPCVALAVQGLSEARPLLQQIQESAGTGWTAHWLTLARGEGPVPRWLQFHLGVTAADIQSFVRQTIGQLSTVVTRTSLGVARNLVSLLAQVILVLLTSFFLLRDSECIHPLLQRLLPGRSRQLDRLLPLAADTLRASVYSQVAVATVQGTLGGVAFWVLGLPTPLLWGVVMAILCLAPVLGAPVVWIPAAIYLVLQGSYWKALALASWGLLAIGTIDNLLRPLLIGARAAIHPLVMFFGILGGAIVIGPLGLFVGPVLLVLTRDVMEMIGAELAARPAQPPTPPGAAGVDGREGSAALDAVFRYSDQNLAPDDKDAAAQ